MKKLIFTLALAISTLALSSCISYDHEDLNLNFSVAQKYSVSGNGKSIKCPELKGSLNEVRKYHNHRGSLRIHFILPGVASNLNSNQPNRGKWLSCDDNIFQASMLIL